MAKTNDDLVPKSYEDWHCNLGCKNPDAWKCRLRTENRPELCKCICHKERYQNQQAPELDKQAESEGSQTFRPSGIEFK